MLKHGISSNFLKTYKLAIIENEESGQTC